MLMAVVRTSLPVNDALPATRLALLDEPLPLYRGGVLENAVVAYETWGKLNARARQRHGDLHGPVAERARRLVLRRSEAGLVGIDAWRRQTDRHSSILRRLHQFARQPFGSTGPASIDPRTGRPYGVSFPGAVEDIARAGREALRTLGINRRGLRAGSFDSAA